MNPSDDVTLIIRLARAVTVVFILLLILLIPFLVIYTNPSLLNILRQPQLENTPDSQAKEQLLWIAPDLKTLPDTDDGKMIKYGHDLIAQTASFIGPFGSVSKEANGMNCQNCHLEAGTKPYGNNFGSVSSMYPKFRLRSGTTESIEKRVNDCLERSLNGRGIDSLSKEMRAIVAYIHWLGKDVPKGHKVAGSGLYELKWMDRPADAKAGKRFYLQKCQVCHGASGEGQKLTANSNYIYPPLSGENSFNTGAGLYRISNFAKYIHVNMPHGATYQNPILSEQESWDIAAYVLSMPRAEKVFPNDWPKMNTKPIDHPFGPYADHFSEQQHKLGPFKPIEEFYKTRKQ